MEFDSVAFWRYFDMTSQFFHLVEDELGILLLIVNLAIVHMGGDDLWGGTEKFHLAFDSYCIVFFP